MDVITAHNSEMDDITKLYFPHMWVKRKLPVNAIQEHMDYITKASEKVRRHIRCELNLPYGFGDREKYDIIGIDLPEDSAILIHLHGGYWQVEETTHTTQTFLAKILHKHGIKVITVGYELSPNVRLPDIAKNIENAVKRCLEYAKNCKAKQVFLMGHSAGAHLVANLFTKFIYSLTKDDQRMIKATYLLCGIYDVTPLIQIPILNDVLKLDETVANEMSPLRQANTFSCTGTEFHIITAENDAPAFIEQGEVFHKKLLSRGIVSNYHFVDGVDHFDIFEKLENEDYKITQLIVGNVQCK